VRSVLTNAVIIVSAIVLYRWLGLWSLAAGILVGAGLGLINRRAHNA
jgi:hypothetical protein